MENRSHCCAAMERALKLDCQVHDSIYDCADVLIEYVPYYDDYGIIIHDGGTSKSHINYCPWCGTKLPESKRDRWFERLEAMRIDLDADEEVPSEMLVYGWWET